MRRDEEAPSEERTTNGTGLLWAAATVACYLAVGAALGDIVTGTEAGAVEQFTGSLAVLTMWALTWFVILPAFRHLSHRPPGRRSALDGPAWRSRNSWRYCALTTLAVTVGTLLVEQGLVSVLRQGASAPATYADVPAGASPTWVAALTGAMLLAGLVEEPLFRGALQGVLVRFLPSSRVTPTLAVVISASVFVWPHINRDLGYDAIGGVAVFIAGIAYGWLAIRVGLWGAVLAHTAHNAVAVADIVSPALPSLLVAAMVAPVLFVAGRDGSAVLFARLRAQGV